jgi:hypothetical protein
MTKALLSNCMRIYKLLQKVGRPDGMQLLVCQHHCKNLAATQNIAAKKKEKGIRRSSHGVANAKKENAPMVEGGGESGTPWAKTTTFPGGMRRFGDGTHANLLCLHLPRCRARWIATEGELAGVLRDLPSIWPADRGGSRKREQQAQSVPLVAEREEHATTLDLTPFQG